MYGVSSVCQIALLFMSKIILNAYPDTRFLECLQFPYWCRVKLIETFFKNYLANPPFKENH